MSFIQRLRINLKISRINKILGIALIYSIFFGIGLNLGDVIVNDINIPELLFTTLVSFYRYFLLMVFILTFFYNDNGLKLLHSIVTDKKKITQYWREYNLCILLLLVVGTVGLLVYFKFGEMASITTRYFNTDFRNMGAVDIVKISSSIILAGFAINGYNGWIIHCFYQIGWKLSVAIIFFTIGIGVLLAPHVIRWIQWGTYNEGILIGLLALNIFFYTCTDYFVKRLEVSK